VTGVLQDVRYALRQLRKSPGFATVVVITLALGIGATTAIFSVVNTVLLAPLPYRDVDRLAMIWGSNPSKGDLQFPISSGDFTDWKQKNDAFEDIAASYDDEMTLTGTAEPKMVLGYAITPNYFRILDVPPKIGRTFTDQEAESRTKVAVLSDQFWRTTLHADPQILGKSITLDAKPFTIIGVMPPTFDYPPKTELWMPMAFDRPNDYEHRFVKVLGRRKAGLSLQAAQTRMDALERQIASQHPDTDAGNVTSISPLRKQLVGDIQTPLLVLSGAVGLVLLISCVNIASLLLARGAGRRGDVSVRLAIGATRIRLLQQFLCETLVLSFIGGAIGLALAVWCTRLLIAIFPNNVANLGIPKVEAIPINGPVLWFAFGTTLLTGLIFAVIPALQSGDLRASGALRGASRTMASHSSSSRVRRMLVSAEVALSLVLIMGAGLMLESFQRVHRENIGFQPEKLLALEVFLPPNQYPSEQPEKRTRFVTDVLERMRELPGVQSVAATNFLPLTGFWGTTDFSIEGQPLPKDQPPLQADNRLATPGYFSTIGASFLRGRDFSESDRPDSEKVAVVNSALARKYFGGSDPIGKVLEIGDPGHIEKWHIVGEIADLKAFGPEEAAHADIFRPLQQQAFPLLAFTLRTNGDPASLLKPAEQALWSVDKDQPVFDAMPMSLLMGQAFTLRRISTILLGTFAALALLLAAVGLFGVMSYSVVQRTHEIGLRMALGARRGDVLGLLMRQGAWIVVLGEIVGLVAALVLMRAVSGFLYGVSASDPVAVIASAGLLIVVAMVASYVPARRAMKVDPMMALRYE